MKRNEQKDEAHTALAEQMHKNQKMDLKRHG